MFNTDKINPVNNLHGDLRAAMSSLIDVYLALDLAQIAMRKARPHMRDYTDKESYNEARAIWEAQIVKIDKLKNDSMNLAKAHQGKIQ